MESVYIEQLRQLQHVYRSFIVDPERLARRILAQIYIRCTVEYRVYTRKLRKLYQLRRNHARYIAAHYRDL